MNVLQIAQLAQLGVGEGGLGGSAAADDDDLLDLAVLEHVERVVGGVGERELGVREREHAGDVERDVAVADDKRARHREVELELAMVGVAVVPADEVGRGPTAGERFTGDAERPVGGRAGGVDDGVVALKQLLTRDVCPEFDVSEEAEARVQRGLLVDAHDGLDLGMVGRDAGAHEAVRRGQALEHVDVEVAFLEQMAGGVEAGGTGADDGDAHGRGVVKSHWWFVGRGWLSVSGERGAGDAQGAIRTATPPVRRRAMGTAR